MDKWASGRQTRRWLAAIVAAGVVFTLLGCGSGSGSSGLTAFGASVSSWNSRHKSDPNFIAGTAYDPTPGLGLANGTSDRFDDRYYEVDTTSGPVIDYSMRLYPGTRIRRARAIAMREFPPDARVDWFTTKHACAQMEISSAALSKADGPHPIAALVEFSAGNSYSPGSVTEILLVGLLPTSATASPNC